jgi:YYY domain-containing protein
VLVKFLGIVPSIAYNLILPTLFAMIAMGAFSVGWNLLWKDESGMQKVEDERGVDTVEGETVSPTQIDATDMETPNLQSSTSLPKRPLYTGLIAAFLMAVLGNLGTLRMILDGFKVNGAPVGEIEGASFFSRVLWTITGAFETITGTALPYRMDEWYWNPSRVIGYEHGGPITEFPYFTFLYGDLHAHLIALPIALLAISWAFSVVLGRAWCCDGKRSVWRIGAGLFLGGLIVGALYPVNLSDIYTYLPLGVAALAYAIWFYGDTPDRKPDTARRTIFLIAAAGVFAVLALFLYKPYSDWYGQGYSEIQLWKGTRTPVMDYLTHWGAFIFIFLAWMFSETVDWMASTPVSALRKLQPYRGLILVLVAILVIVIAILGINLYPEGIPPEISLPLGIGVSVIWFVLPLAVWAGVLLLRPGISDAKRFTFFMVGTGLVLTLMVEIIVVSGDIGRMNTVFKFYLHVWALFAVSAAAVVIWMWQNMSQWKPGWRLAWQIGLVFFVGSMLFYPLTATLAKVRDRMAPNAPHTLDGMTYMQYATHHDEGAEMDLSQDYNAIRWMQDNIEGSPVIVEAHLTEYRWGTRNTIYTGLPGVVGWNWHQRQQRTLLPENWVWDRVNAIQEFYDTTDVDYATDFLKRYDVSYIIIGQLERAKYSPEGIAKFEERNGSLWNEVFRDRDTVIYEVVSSNP